MSRLKREKAMTIGAIILLVIVIFLAGYHLERNAYQVIHENDRPLEKDSEKIFAYMRSELVYAHDVTNASKKPNDKHDWHCLYIKNNILYRDHKPVFSLTWYEKRQVSMTYVGYIRSKSRIDFTLTIQENKQSYTKRQSLKLLSIDLENSIDKRLPTGEQTYDLSITKSSLNKKKYKLYYYQ